MTTALDRPVPESARRPRVATRSGAPRQRPSLRVEPLAALEWSSATEFTAADRSASSPAGARHAWVCTANEDTVLALYRASMAADPQTEAPWWLAPLADGRLGSRAEAFALEDRVAELLLARSGWVYSPWGQNGYWEYLPSERAALNPTTLLCTGRHDGWLDVLGAYDGEPPDPVAVRGLPGLRADLGWIEKV